MYTFFKRFTMTSFLVILLLSINKNIILASTYTYDKNKIKAEIENIYNTRSSSFITGNTKSLNKFFDTSRNQSKWALQHEINRIKYLQDWSKSRNIKFKNITSSVRIKKINTTKKYIKVYLEESYKFDYLYNFDKNKTINSFGVGIRHSLNLTNKDNKWIILSDWYTDCFEDALSRYNNSVSENITTAYTNSPKFAYNRKKAVEYANKYCGAAWGNKNNFKYNPKYKDYTGKGGDCTNFISQVLSDAEGGSLSSDSAWKKGSYAWVNADGLKNYLLFTGKGTVIKKGTFKELTTLLNNKGAAITKLRLGDLICYEKSNNNIDHFAIVTGFDSEGYPLINSHTTDRYKVPWDLGWGDANIKFLLIHINE